jgi:hypothetical protein
MAKYAFSKIFFQQLDTLQQTVTQTVTYSVIHKR